MLDNKLGINFSTDLALVEERISKKKAVMLFDEHIIHNKKCGKFSTLQIIHKYLFEDIETNNTKKIADLVLNEAIDNGYGTAKDDMSVVVCKFLNKE